jgi:PLD-like domain
MRLLTTSSSLRTAFGQLLAQHKRLSFAVAWASHSFPGYDELLKYQHKIEKGIVGIHFYQTHPSFIKHFLTDNRIRFAKDSSGIFHPKFYLFDTSEDDWSCLIGSANFTAAAFSANTEACLLFDAKDDHTGATKRKLAKALARYWKSSGYFKPSELEQYRSLWDLFRQRRKGMAGDFNDKSGGKPVLRTPLLKMSWSTYYRRVLQDRHHGIDKRIAVLDEARRLFEVKQSLSRMAKPERQGIAGFSSDDDVHWRWFGSMFGAGIFKKLVNANSPRLSGALDAIPLRGEVRREHYLAFIAAYVDAYPQRRRHGLATATRLLAMKRPDYFVCFDSENRDGLCKAFGTRLSHHDYERYWDSVVERILISEWWASRRPTGEREGKIWDGRAAFLDSLYYKPKPK